MTTGQTRQTDPARTLTGAERRYEKNLARTGGMLRSWRTPARRRLLVRLNWACIAVMAAIAVIGFFWFPIVLAWLPMTVAIMTAWTMLRVTIDARDTAPLRYLDEFEAETLLRARSTALSVLTGLLAVIALALVFGASFEVGDGHRLAYAMGGLGILGVFVGGVIPAAAMARTMDDEDEVDHLRTGAGTRPDAQDR